ncbi:hypothetical protein [Agromyces luteolus]|uniref:Uncharacterized protein n=1 Tax=Agromyces luteolus TaxID=88373 RepID=A0A7C9HML4_9MICO|nr:hypothetical protein [Agromyces luteolus]MUN08022.1 hypothetical protein [Agromyces luteolus]
MILLDRGNLLDRPPELIGMALAGIVVQAKRSSKGGRDRLRRARQSSGQADLALQLQAQIIAGDSAGLSASSRTVSEAGSLSLRAQRAM